MSATCITTGQVTGAGSIRAIHLHLHGVQWVTPSITVQIKASPEQAQSHQEQKGENEHRTMEQRLVFILFVPFSSLEVITHPHGVWLNLVVCKCDHNNCMHLL